MRAGDAAGGVVSRARARAAGDVRARARRVGAETVDAAVANGSRAWIDEKCEWDGVALVVGAREVDQSGGDVVVDARAIFSKRAAAAVFGNRRRRHDRWDDVRGAVWGYVGCGDDGLRDGRRDKAACELY